MGDSFYVHELTYHISSCVMGQGTNHPPGHHWDENTKGDRSEGQRQLEESTQNENDRGGCENVSYVLL